MDEETWKHLRRRQFVIIKVLACVLLLCGGGAGGSGLDDVLKEYVDRVLSVDKYSLIPGVGIEKAVNGSPTRTERQGRARTERKDMDSVQEYVQKKLQDYTNTHVMAVNVPATARFFQQVFIGAQLVKSVLIAMFLPSILGGLGKLLGKGLSTFSGISGASAGMNNNNNQQQIEDFEFKDTSPYANDDGTIQQDFDGESDTLTLNIASSTVDPPVAHSRFGMGNQRISYVAHQQNDNYYARKPARKTDYKVFHKIPSSSMLLTSYDPFYSPLLSRLDAVFQQLGLGNDKSPETEKCRERLVCLMYSNPAKYAPYSNLVSAQLSRELNELRKPASDNPEILRFFRYMKAAKDGQDGEECLAHGGCPSLSSNQPSPAIITTFNDINKLVQARRLS